MATKLECPRCGSEIDDLSCEGCGKQYQQVLGVPFIGAYERDDVLGLIEIAANAPNRGRLSTNQQFVAELEELCRGYHDAADKDAFVAQTPGAQPSYFLNRYGEWVETHHLLEGEDLVGKNVLDVGAGVGFDSQRIALAGAKVTALEFSPILAEAGKQGAPNLDWYGGLSHALPFAGAQFDAVFCNAALHHMRDIPTAISEALRMLKVGGTLYTSCDSFRANAQPADIELSIFNRSEAVLMGVNEQIPPMQAFIETLLANRDILDVTVFTHTLHGGRSGSDPDLTAMTPWTLEDAASWLGERSGSLAMKVKLLAPWPRPRALQTNGVIEARDFADLLDDQSEALASLSAILSDEYVNADANHASKFMLLNGWQAPAPDGSRTAYGRGRWFLRKGAAKQLKFEAACSSSGPVDVLINGRLAQQLKLAPEWRPVAVDLSELPEAKPFAVELRRSPLPAEFEKACFRVRNRKLTGPTLMERLFGR